MYWQNLRKSEPETQFPFLQNIGCQRIIPSIRDENHGVLCPTLTKDHIEDFIAKIKDDYQIQLLVDNLPFANLQDQRTSCGDLPPSDIGKLSKETTKYSRPDGFPVGCVFYPDSVKDATEEEREKKAQYFVNNHFSFVIKYNIKWEKGNKVYYVVGAEVYPTSINHKKPNQATCELNNEEKFQIDSETTSIPFSYSVNWVETNIEYPSRWDAYLKAEIDEENDDYKIHWFSLINSAMIVIFLSGMIAMIMLRILRKDIGTYNKNDEDPEDPISDESGWKLVYGDVFRSPSNSALLSIMVGSGLQLGVIFALSLGLSILGFMSPENRGRVLTALVFSFLFTGVISGYYSLRFYKLLEGTRWKSVAIGTTLFVPLTVATIYGILNTIMWGMQSTLAQPFLSILTVVGVWFVVSIPLVFIGAYFGYRKEADKHPAKVHQIPRQIPAQPFLLRPPFVYLIGGILPFGAVFIEVYFVLSSVWLHQFYYLFGFLLFVFLVLLLTCAETTIVFVYFQLCNEDYRWWWRSFLCSGSSAFYLFLYGIVYYWVQLNIPHIAMTVLYFGYMLIVSFLFMLLTGSVGFVSTLWFVRKIYGSIKIE